MAYNKNTEEKWTEAAPVLHVDPPTGSRKGAHQSSRARYFQKSLAIWILSQVLNTNQIIPCVQHLLVVVGGASAHSQ